MKSTTFSSVSLLSVVCMVLVSGTHVFHTLGLTDKDMGENMYSSMAKSYKQAVHDSFTNNLNMSRGVTVIVPEDHDPSKLKEMRGNPAKYAEKFLCGHTIGEKYTLDELAEEGTVDTVCGGQLNVKRYGDTESDRKYTVNGIECRDGSEALSVAVNLIHCDEPVWYPPSASSDPSTAGHPLFDIFIDIFQNACSVPVPSHAMEMFIPRFDKFTRLGETPITFIKPLDDILRTLCLLIPINPVTVIRELAKHTGVGSHGILDLEHLESMKNLLGDDVAITKVGGGYKYGDTVFDPEDCESLASGKGFFCKDSPVVKPVPKFPTDFSWFTGG